MPMTQVWSRQFNTQANVEKFYHSPATLAGGVGNLRFANDGTHSYAEITLGRPAGTIVGYPSYADMTAATPPAGTTAAFAFDKDPALHGTYPWTGSAWGARSSPTCGDRGYDDPNHRRRGWLELLFQSWSAAGDPGAPSDKIGFPNIPDLRGYELRYLMRAKDLRLGENAKIVQHLQTVHDPQNNWPDTNVQRSFVNVLQIANPISDQLFLGRGGYNDKNSVRGVHDTGWVEVVIPLRPKETDWLDLGGVEGRQGLPGEEVRYYNYAAAPIDQVLADWTGNAMIVAVHKTPTEALKTNPPADADKVEGTIQIREVSLWAPA